MQKNIEPKIIRKEISEIFLFKSAKKFFNQNL